MCASAALDIEARRFVAREIINDAPLATRHGRLSKVMVSGRHCAPVLRDEQGPHILDLEAALRRAGRAVPPRRSGSPPPQAPATARRPAAAPPTRRRPSAAAKAAPPASPAP
ncbi:unnamed protein product [Prorocentrum cordatum]|uniref:Uncharacterized protein n=1 Tax=Prorocentrum cordatum TaxID=2364126 RepID=A0ABN9PA77_9DINO|nr:unnamed protein product [Polarella glacialis]